MDRNLTIAITLIAIGVTGLGIMFYLNYIGFFTPGGLTGSNGQLIFTRGVNENGVVISFSGGPPWLRMMGGSCVNCHGSNGRGGFYPMMCNVVSADVRYSALVSEGFNNSTIKRAITEGIDESGDDLSSCMPHWSMSDKDLNDLISYLSKLG